MGGIHMKITRLLAPALLASCSSLSFAQSYVNTATITAAGMFYSAGDYLFLMVSGTQNNKPSCSTNLFPYVIDLSTAMGTQMMALVLAARTAQTPIQSISGPASPNAARITARSARGSLSKRRTHRETFRRMRFALPEPIAHKSAS
jgi:hypothetical protein